jgi:A nuclease family of the HNH/ENDO VII superfamily with conserved AHH
MAAGQDRWPNRAFRTPTRPGWHRHHLLPNHVRHYPDLRDFMLGVAGSGVALDDFATNGMFLPAEERLACAAHLPLHRGSHRTYNAIVIDALDSIRRVSLSARIGGPRRVAVVRHLQSRLKSLLCVSALDTQVLLASRDPSGSTPIGDLLDRQTDALFEAALAREADEGLS